MKLPRKHFNSLEEYAEYLLIAQSSRILECLIKCDYRENPEKFSGKSADVYDLQAKEAVRFAKAWIKELKLK